MQSARGGSYQSDEAECQVSGQARAVSVERSYFDVGFRLVRYDQFQPDCGDGIVNGTEECDDGNRAVESCACGELACESCAANCTLQAGETAFCGDGILHVDQNEECDYEDAGCNEC